MPRIPRKMRLSQTPLAAEWNAMVDCIQSLVPIDGPGTVMNRTLFGTSRAATRQRAIGQSTSTASGVTYAGEWNSTDEYDENTLVYTRPSSDPITCYLWISETAVPANTAPEWPEPEAPDTLYWRMLAMTGDAIAVDVCESGTETTYYFYGPPGQGA